MVQEQWLKVDGIDEEFSEAGYEVSNLGRVRNKLGVIMKTLNKHQHVLKNGDLTRKNNYETVTLSAKGIKKNFAVHRLVYSSFTHFFIPDGHEVHHADMNKANNNICNLVLMNNIDHQRATKLEHILRKRGLLKAEVAHEI